MLRNYLAIALRNLLKHKGFSAINIVGLAIGIACCVLLSLYIKDEYSYEKHFADHDRIYRVYTTFTRDGVPESFPRTSPPVGFGLAAELPEVATATRVVSPPEVEQHLIRYQDKSFFEKTGYLVDSTFFDIFSFEFQEGDRHTALDGPSSVVLSANAAAKIFGDQSALDELVIINSGAASDTFRITGVLKPADNRSHLNADFYMCMNSRGWGEYIGSVTTWAWQNFAQTYVKLKPGTTPEAVDAKIPALIERYAGNDLRNSGVSKELHLQALDDIRLYSNFQNTFGMSEDGTIVYVYILGSIGIFILLIACINFMNLTTAKASQRAGEVGVRKSLGATRSNLIRQFLGESMAIVVAAMLFAMGLVQVLLPLFNNLTGKQLELTGTNLAYIGAALVFITLVTGVIGGSYPAFFLSSFQPAKVLKDKRLSGGSSNLLRRSLVTFQFVISITLIASIVIIQRQLNFIQSKSLGFRADDVFMIPLRTAEARQEYPQLKNALAQISGVELVSATTALPSTPVLRDFSVYPMGSTMEKSILHRNIWVDENYFKLLNINLLAGREFIYESDSISWENQHRNVIVNKASLQAFQIQLEEAVGSILLTEWEGKRYEHKIIGVVDDFHQFSLHQEIKPMMFFIPARRNDFGFITATARPEQYQQVIAQFQQTWKTLAPATPFESALLHDNVQKQYTNDKRVSLILTIFTLIAISISCLGLYGLSVYVAERRVKEIGIRKVLGASVGGIVTLLSREFLKLVLIAFVIAVPIGYYAMSQWLESFAYRIELDVVVFLVAGVLSVGIAWFTIGFESIKAAIANPVKSLRNE